MVTSLYYLRYIITILGFSCLHIVSVNPAGGLGCVIALLIFSLFALFCVDIALFSYTSPITSFAINTH